MTTAGSDVVALDTRPPQRSDVAYRHVDVLDLAEVVQATRDLDVVLHLAGLSDATDALARPVSAVQVNVADWPTTTVWLVGCVLICGAVNEILLITPPVAER